MEGAMRVESGGLIFVRKGEVILAGGRCGNMIRVVLVIVMVMMIVMATDGKNGEAKDDK